MIYKKNYLQKFQLYIKTSKFISISVTLVNSLTYLIYIHTYTLLHPITHISTNPTCDNQCVFQLHYNPDNKLFTSTLLNIKQITYRLQIKHTQLQRKHNPTMLQTNNYHSEKLTNIYTQACDVKNFNLILSKSRISALWNIQALNMQK
eukprot:EC097377.1.p1 GENE.EC097377.1~~EC097377.1.p1  ORF type:complete len:148 (-),score=6.63 EC097377.1:149-592(-)